MACFLVWHGDVYGTLCYLHYTINRRQGQFTCIQKRFLLLHVLLSLRAGIVQPGECTERGRCMKHVRALPKSKRGKGGRFRQTALPRKTARKRKDMRFARRRAIKKTQRRLHLWWGKRLDHPGSAGEKSSSSKRGVSNSAVTSHCRLSSKSNSLSCPTLGGG